MSTPNEIPPDGVPEDPGGISPRRSVVLIGLDHTISHPMERFLAEQGWHIASANDGPTGRSLVRHLSSSLVVLQPRLPCESGWITCAKLRLVTPTLPLVVVVEEGDWRARQFAHFLGARVQFREDESLAGLPPLLVRLQPVPLGEPLRAGTL